MATRFRIRSTTLGSAIFEAILHRNIYPVSPTLQTILNAFDLTSLFAFLTILAVLACAIVRRDPALGSIAIAFVTLALFSGSLNLTTPVFTEVYSYCVFSPVLLALAIEAMTRRSALAFSLFGIVSLRSMLLAGEQAAVILRSVLR